MNRKYFLLSIILLLFWFCSSTVLRNNFGSSVRYINDEADRWDYFVRGKWLPEGKVPYRDVFSEYPQVSTYLFGIIYLPFLKWADADIAYTAYTAYSTFFSLIMVYILLALAIVLEKELPDEKRKLFWCLFLPAPLYFTLNRFDVLPSFISLAALILVRREKWALAGCLLAIGALTKWYPALLVPAVLVYMFYQRESWRTILQFLLAFGLTCFIILLPTFIAGGVRAILVPYINLQNKRGYDPDSLLGLMLPLLKILMPLANEQGIKVTFLSLQFSAVPFLLLARINSFEKLVNCCLIVISIFMMFAPLYSPQWMLWILPLMILVARNRLDIALIVVYGVISYITFPVIFDYYGATSFQMLTMGWVNIVLLILITIQSVGRLRSLSQRHMIPSSLTF